MQQILWVQIITTILQINILKSRGAKQFAQGHIPCKQIEESKSNLFISESHAPSDYIQAGIHILSSDKIELFHIHIRAGV